LGNQTEIVSKTVGIKRAGKPGKLGKLNPIAFRNPAMSRIRFMLPQVKTIALGRPQQCPHCQGGLLQRHSLVQKPVKDLREAIEKHIGLLGMVTIPLLHSLSGSAGAADELLIALVGGLVLVLVLSLVLGGNKGRRQDKDEQPDNEGL